MSVILALTRAFQRNTSRRGATLATPCDIFVYVACVADVAINQAIVCSILWPVGRLSLARRLNLGRFFPCV